LAAWHGTSRARAHLVLEVIINRGHYTGAVTPYGRKEPLTGPIALKFGQTTALSISPACNILEAHLLTDQGEVSYSFTPQS
jgi:hypothetical protein